MDAELVRLLYWIAGIVIAIISYFLKKTHGDMIEQGKEIDKINTKVNDLNTKIEVNKVEVNLRFDALNEKYDAILKALSEITYDIKDINKKLK